MDLVVVLGASSFTNFTQALVKAIALGSIYAVLALGFVLIFKATQTVNFAHGAIAMAGALFLSILIVDEGLPLLPWGNPIASLPGPDWVTWFANLALALVLTAVLGLVIERLTIRPMIGEPLFSVAVITLGLEIMLRTFAVDAVEISTRPLAVPWGRDFFRVGETAIAWSYVAAVIAAAVAFISVFLFFRTRTGVAMRAVAFDQEAAMAQGINVGRVFAIAWAAGAALAALGGVFASMSPWPPSGAVSTEGAFIAFRAFPAVILGGLDSVVGALVGGMIIGFAEIFAGEYGSHLTDTLGAGYQQVVPYVVMLIGLLIRPYGIFGTPEVRRV
jgi:branched-chain amino acid transport system permease protein